MVGATQIWVFMNPELKGKAPKGGKAPEITYDYAQEEIAAKNGITMNDSNDG